MAIPFPVPPAATPEEALLAKLGLDYERRADGMIVATGDVHLYNDVNLTALPDLSKVILQGSFYCHESRLTSLKGAPCSVSGNFSCYGNQLTSLEHAPRDVGGQFYCHRNLLTSLEHLPARIGTDFWCHTNRLTSLEHCPGTVNGSFYCNRNSLESLEGAPQKFKYMKSDFGEFQSWDEVPPERHLSPATKARQAREQKERTLAQSETAVRKATVLQKPLTVSTPLRLKRSRRAP